MYIKSIKFNLFNNDIFDAEIELNENLNVISGLNGTGKTEFLKRLKSGIEVMMSDGTIANSSTQKMFAISPKRMVDSKTIDVIAQEYRTQNKSIKQFAEFIKNQQIKSSGFDPYPPFPELFVQSYEDKVDTKGETKPDAVSSTKDDFNKILQMVFPDYKIDAKWITESGTLNLGISKFGMPVINHEQLSTGEREVLALIFSIYSSKDYEDIILIDEPEIHLNWNLEKGLFTFLDWFCTTFKKQVIVVTHSRIIFEEKFIKNVQYFVWRKNKIKVEKSLPDDEKSQIAGEAIQTLSVVLTPTVKTFIVEDNQHKHVINELAQINKRNIQILVANGKSNVEMFFELSKKESWPKLFFLVDGDNQGEKYSDPNFIQLSKYCIQNYFLDIPVLVELSNRSDDEVKKIIIESVKLLPKSNNNLPFIKLSELTNSRNFPFELLDYLDADKIIENVFQSLGLHKDFYKTSKLFIEKSNTSKTLNNIFSEILTKL